MHRLKYMMADGQSLCNIMSIHNLDTMGHVSPCNALLDSGSSNYPTTTTATATATAALLSTLLFPGHLSSMQRSSSRLHETIATLTSPLPFTSTSGIIGAPSPATVTSNIFTPPSQSHSSQPSPSATVLKQDELTLREDPVSAEEETRNDTLIT